MSRHYEHEDPLERFWYVSRTRVVFECESFWDTKEEAEAEAAKHPGAKVEAPDTEWLGFIERMKRDKDAAFKGAA